MGMDVIGRNPTDEIGTYFRASVWSWRPIYCLIEEANQRFQLALDLEGFEFNEGAGLDSQDDCNRLAGALEALLQETTASAFTLDSAPMGSEAAALSALISAGWEVGSAPRLEGAVAVAPACYSAARQHVMDFIAFLYASGGFEIW